MRVPGLCIGEHVFEPRRGVLRAPDGADVALRPKTSQVLLYLAERGGEVVARDDLIAAVWPGIFVTDDSITQCVGEIRRALGPDGALLRTLPRRGYVLDIPPAIPPSMPAAPRPTGRVPVVAIMPLRLPPGEERDLAPLADILLDGVVGALAALREPIVISANTTRLLAGAMEPVPGLARRVGADYLVAGSLLRLAGRVRLSVELAEAAQGAVVWQRAYEVTPNDPVEALDELVTTIAHTVLPRLRDAELRLARRRRHDLGAYHLMLEGQALMVRLERGSFERAGEMLRRAASLDPGFAAPHAVMANWHSLRIGQRWSDDPAAEARALEAEVRRALELDGGHARALALLGHSSAVLHRDHDRAQELLERALGIAPNDAETNLWMSPTLAFGGRGRESVRQAERALRLSPEDPLLFRYQHFLSIAHYAEGDWEAAAHWGLKAMRSNDSYTSNLAQTAAALAALGRTEEAREPVLRLLELTPHVRVSLTEPRLPYRDRALAAQYAGHLRAAGVPP
jgi:adenylate cyclase